MKTLPRSLAIAALLAVLPVFGQGTFVYDQQSSINEAVPRGIWSVQFEMPVQSFTPTLSSVGFIRLRLTDDDAANTVGATLYVNLREGGQAGPIISSTEPVFMPNGFDATTNFFFAGGVPVTPGATYFFEPVVISGDRWRITVGELGYSGGQAYNQGIPTGVDLWFREGIIVPEPSVITLIMFGVGALVLFRRNRSAIHLHQHSPHQ